MAYNNYCIVSAVVVDGAAGGKRLHILSASSAQAAEAKFGSILDKINIDDSQDMYRSIANRIKAGEFAQADSIMRLHLGTLRQVLVGAQECFVVFDAAGKPIRVSKYSAWKDPIVVHRD